MFRSQTQSFVDQVWRYEGLLGSVPLDPAPVAAYARFLAEEVDGRHGAKEEQGLFPVLARYVPEEGGPVGLLMAEHQGLRGEQQVLTQVARKLETDAEAAESQREVLRAAREVQQLLDTHIEKEESVLFPMARQLLSDREVAEVWELFRQFEADHGAVRPIPSARDASRGPALPPFCAAGRARREESERA